MKKFDVYAIGNALVDSEYQVSEVLLRQSGVEKRHMTLIDAPRRAELLQHMHDVPSHRTGGGSAGNTIVAVAQFGGKAFYSCRVAEDELGAFYTQDLASHGALIISYSTGDGQQEQKNVSLPWTKVVGTAKPGFTASVEAQFSGFGTITCRILADSKVIQSRTSAEEPYTAVQCST